MYGVRDGGDGTFDLLLDGVALARLDGFYARTLRECIADLEREPGTRAEDFLAGLASGLLYMTLREAATGTTLLPPAPLEARAGDPASPAEAGFARAGNVVPFNGALGMPRP